MRAVRRWGWATLALLAGLIIGYVFDEWNVSRNCANSLYVAGRWNVLMEVLRQDPYNTPATTQMTQLQSEFDRDLENCRRAFLFH